MMTARGASEPTQCFGCRGVNADSPYRDNTKIENGGRNEVVTLTEAGGKSAETAQTNRVIAVTSAADTTVSSTRYMAFSNASQAYNFAKGFLFVVAGKLPKANTDGQKELRISAAEDPHLSGRNSASARPQGRVCAAGSSHL